jgi:hypothetical protein
MKSSLSFYKYYEKKLDNMIPAMANPSGNLLIKKRGLFFSRVFRYGKDFHRDAFFAEAHFDPVPTLTS